MVLPKPIHPLTDHCSVVVDKTLYVYSPAGFQSLLLEEGEKWKDMPMGMSVTGGQCVKAVPGGDPNAAMLYIVGGTVNETASTWDYPGLQKYSFAQQKWDWVRPKDLVTQNRRNHAAVYLNASQSLLVFSGSQSGDNGPSSSTFVIQTQNLGVASYSSAAPPTVKPMLLPWDDRHAVMLGGGNGVFTFSPEEGWRNLGVTLTSPITNQETTKCSIVSGDDGSKVLEIFDMGASPNKVSRVALLTAGGAVAAPGMTIGDGPKRELTLNGWPAYNGTFAPNVTRSGFSAATDANGVVVISGGNEQDPLCMFDQKANSWLNTTEIFTRQFTAQSTPSFTTSASPSPTSPTATATVSTEAIAPLPVSPNNKSRTLTVLGATLGTIFGIAALLVLLLMCLRWKKGKKKKELQDGYIEKDRLSFADRGAAFMSEAGGSVGHKYSASMNQSQSSLAIISGRTAGNHKRGLGPLGSDASTQALVHKKSPLGYSDSMEMSKLDLKGVAAESDRDLERDFEKSAPVPAARPAAPTGRSRSSGWSRYFANNEATNLAAMPADRSTYASERTSTGSQSMYTNSQVYSQPVQTIPPLEVNFNRFDGQRLSQVATGSPTLGNSQENLPHQPMQAELARANSNGSTRSGISQDDHYHRKPVESWTPVGGDYGQRPPSSNYTNSVVLTDNHMGANPYNYNSLYPGRPAPAEGRDSTVTVFPRGVPDHTAPRRQNEDMSWLNLGHGGH